MRYAIRKDDHKAQEPWSLISPHGTRITTAATARALVKVARVLAGWRGSVVIEGGRKASA